MSESLNAEYSWDSNSESSDKFPDSVQFVFHSAVNSLQDTAPLPSASEAFIASSGLGASSSLFIIWLRE